MQQETQEQKRALQLAPDYSQNKSLCLYRGLKLELLMQNKSESQGNIINSWLRHKNCRHEDADLKSSTKPRRWQRWFT